ncbi:hypothetical protein [Archangium sp.]|uniref:hypothetical protein n=1 Tax=Archangium sp. TaxID=1872627 RepID=UPI002D2CD65A|nr:hypothetical protein [Archangium sp.]HYO54779.1 hypothetical protein [Archangium sp.]
MAFVLVTRLAGLAHAEPPASLPPPDSTAPGSRPSVCGNLTTQALPGYKVPGRKPNSQMPWELFLGNASHRLIAYIYGTRHPTNMVFHNKESIKRILENAGLGDSSLLPENEREIRPDITDVSARNVFEVKPHSEQGLQEGNRKVQIYLLALNRTLTPADRFSAGEKFEGEILIQFTQGQYIWRLEWCTIVPGVTQYRWTRSQERLDSNAAAYQAGQWVEITEQELKQYGGWVAQAVEGMVDRRERLATLSETIGVAIDIVGKVAIGVISTAMSGERGASQPGGKVLPFPSKPSPTAPPVQLPKASGM